MALPSSFLPRQAPAAGTEAAPIPSVPAGRIAELVGSGPAGLLEQHGFRKQGHVFSRKNAESVSILAFQSKTLDSANGTKFTLNLRNFFPALEARTGAASTMASRMAASEGCRIGHLMPPHEDRWWVITPTSDLQALGTEVTAAIAAYALPWLERLATIDALVDYWHTVPHLYPDAKVIRALALAGRQDEVAVFYRKCQAAWKNPTG